MKYLITGSSGFVSKHFIDYISELTDENEFWGIDSNEPTVEFQKKFKNFNFRHISLLDKDSLHAILDEIRPDRVIHLAAYSSVAYSWNHPVECFLNNTNIFLNLIDSIRKIGFPCKVLSIGSSEEYGQVLQSNIPLNENMRPSPINPYAVARVAQENLSKLYVKGYGLSIICTRSFNHIGPDQSDTYVVSSFVKQAVEVYFGKRDFIDCGKLDIIRDFIDVRDVVRAYYLLFEKGTSGEIYNICSGQGISLEQLLLKICQIAGIETKWRINSNLIRPTDNSIIIGDNTKIKKLGFTLSYNLDDSLNDLFIRWKENFKIHNGQ